MDKLEFVSREPIPKGWSDDRKYCVRAADGTRFLLRISSEGKRENRAKLFRIQQEVARLGISMCAPVAFGYCPEGVYSLQTWIDGEDAELAIPRLSADAQYTYGLEAGQILKKIHKIPAPAEQPDWEVRFNAKIDRKIQLYMDCPIKFGGAEYFLSYLEKNRHLLKNRTQCFQHGDYHIGNMMVSKGQLVIIDFDRYDFGDPWEEFNRIVWCAQTSPMFATGMVDGYFHGEVPTLFWRLLALYISSNMLSSVPWAVPFGEGEIRIMLQQVKDVLSWYDNMRRLIPTWYIRPGQ